MPSASRSDSSAFPEPSSARTTKDRKGKGRARDSSSSPEPTANGGGGDNDQDEEEEMEDGKQANGDAGSGGEEDDGEETEEGEYEGLSEAQRKDKKDQRKLARKKQLRVEYRALQGVVDDARGNLANTTVDDLSAQVLATNKLFAKVDAPSEAILDSRVLIATSEAGALKARQLKIDADAFDTDEFLARLKTFLGVRGGGGGGKRRRRRQPEESDEEDELDEEDGRRRGDAVDAVKWGKVGRILSGESRRVPALDFMFGPLSIEIKEKKARTQRAKNKVEEKDRTRPEELHAEDVAKNENETGKVTAKIAKRLLEVAGSTGYPYLAFVVNPHSFSQTVENMFYFSFLMRENKAAIEVETDSESPYFGDMVTFAVAPEDAEEAVTRGQMAKKVQVVLELTEEVWRDAIEAYNITESVIESREAFVAPVATGKYKW
ncbi:hypothetical protein JCM8547_002967 [Rhodosporidiobolus lusitaniae]